MQVPEAVTVVSEAHLLVLTVLVVVGLVVTQGLAVPEVMPEVMELLVLEAAAVVVLEVVLLAAAAAAVSVSMVPGVVALAVLKAAIPLVPEAAVQGALLAAVRMAAEVMVVITVVLAAQEITAVAGLAGLVVVVQFVSCGPVIHVHSHQLALAHLNF